jgi:hypothetical protein
MKEVKIIIIFLSSILSLFFINYAIGMGIGNYHTIPISHRSINATPMPLQNISPTPYLTATQTLQDRLSMIEEHIQKMELDLENSPKDIWDKLSALAPYISGVVAVILAFFVSNLYKKKELAITQAETLHKFIPQLQSKNPREKETALLIIRSLGIPEVATQLAEIFKDPGSIAALNKFAKDDESPEIAKKAKESLIEIHEDIINRVTSILSEFDGQKIKGDLFGHFGGLVLPEKLLKISIECQKFDMFAEFSNNEKWFIEIVTVSRFDTHSFNRLLGYLTISQDEKKIMQNPKLWVIYLGNITNAVKSALVSKDFILVSSLSDVEELESILSETDNN